MAPLLLLPAASRASEVPPDEPKPDEVIEVEGAREQTREIPSSWVTEIAPADLAPGLLTVTDLTRSAPSARVREFGGLGQRSSVGLRGATPYQTRVEIDGVGLPDPLGAGVDLSAFPAGFLERVEILRGAASLQAGSGALGGIVNLVTRQDSSDGFFGRLSAGSHGTFTGTSGAAFGSGQSRFLVAASGLASQGDFPFLYNHNTPYNPYDDSRRTRTNNDALLGGALLKASTTLGSDATLRITQQVTGTERGVAGLLGFTAEHARESSWMEFLDARVEIPFEHAGVLAGASGLMQGVRFTDPRGELTGVPIDSRQEGWQARVFVAPAFELGARSLLRLRASLTRHALRMQAVGEPSRTEIEASAVGQIELVEGSLVLFPGAGLSHASDGGWQATPAIGARLALGEALAIQANLARAYRVPSFNELYLQSGFATGNPELVPESCWTADAGLEWRPGSARLALSGFASQFSDLIVFEPGSNFRYRPINVGAARILGLELEGRLSLRERLWVMGSYTWTLAADRSGRPNREGNRLPGQPEHMAGLRVQGELGRLLGEAGLQFVSSNFVNQANTKELPGRLLVDLGIGVRASREATLMLQARNVLNSQIQDIAGLPLPGVSFFITFEWKSKEEGT